MIDAFDRHSYCLFHCLCFLAEKEERRRDRLMREGFYFYHCFDIIYWIRQCFYGMKLLYLGIVIVCYKFNASFPRMIIIVELG